MSFFRQLIDILLHVDTHLADLAANYGPWVYAILFLIVFCETGLVVTPFLPGDSLLFAVGAMCSLGGDEGLSLWIVIPTLIIAAVFGDAVNYRIGYALGPGFLARRLESDQKPRGLARFIKKQHLEKTQQFYKKHGGKTIILARFVPIVRTFAPFVAGIGRMEYGTFFMFNIIGAVAWVLICTLAGYFFGALPIVKKNFELVVLVIIVLSILPIMIEVIRSRLAKRRATIDAPLNDSES